MKYRRSLLYAVIIVLVLVIIVVLQVVNRDGTRKNGDGDVVEMGDDDQHFQGGDTISRFGSGIMPGTTTPGPRELTEEERLENEREFERMRQKLPDNMWLPGDVSREESRRQEKILRDMIVLGNKVQKGDATKEESRRYYSLKLKSLEDKAELIEYFQERTAEKEKEDGREYLTEDDIHQGEEAIEEIRNEADQFKEKLESIE
ncbi:MAG: hypothetical protein ACOCWZ_05905 [Spirochaetota bacterium]